MSGTPTVPYAGYVGANMISPGTPFVDGGGIIVPINWRFLYQVFDAVNRLAATVNAKAGVTDGSDAAAGQIGEFLSTNTTGSITSGVAADWAILSLSAGDWDVVGSAIINPSSTTALTFAAAWLSPVSATPHDPGRASVQNAAFGYTALNVGPLRVSSNAATSIYLGGQANFLAPATAASYAWISARRMR